MSDDAETPSPPDDATVLDVPLDAAHGATLRLLVASLGADAGFNVDELDDLKLAVSEVFSILVDSEADGSRPDGGNHRVRVSFRVDDETFEVRIRESGAPGRIELDQLSSAILSSVADEHDVSDDGVRIVKHRTRSSV